MESLLFSTVKDSQISLCVPIQDQAQLPGCNLKVFHGPFLLTLNNDQYRNQKIMCANDLMLFAHLKLNLRFLYLEYQQGQKNSKLVISKILEELIIVGEDSQIRELHAAIAKYMVQRKFKRSFLKLKIMGSGSYAKVYKIQRFADQTLFAAKAIKKHSKKFDSDTQMAAILKEIEILQLLDHPNCVKLYQIFEDKRYIYLILNFLSGGDLYQEMIDNGEYKEILIQQVIQNLLQTLAYLNSINVMHRDIKPENIILRERGDLKNLVLSDFGLADLVNPYTEYLFEKCGTIGYVAPEIIRGDPYDTKVDLYSLGVIMFILLSGKSPFDCSGSHELLKLNFIGKIEFALLRESGVSAAGIDLCEKLLNPNPVKRVTIFEALMHDWFIAVPADSLNQISIKLAKYKMRESMQLQNFVKQSPLWRRNEQGENYSPLSLESSFDGNEYELETPDRIRESRYFDQVQLSLSTLDANDDQLDVQNSPSVMMQNYRFDAKLKN